MRSVLPRTTCAPDLFQPPHDLACGRGPSMHKSPAATMRSAPPCGARSPSTLRAQPRCRGYRRGSLPARRACTPLSSASSASTSANGPTPALPNSHRSIASTSIFALRAAARCSRGSAGWRSRGARRTRARRRRTPRRAGPRSTLHIAHRHEIDPLGRRDDRFRADDVEHVAQTRHVRARSRARPTRSRAASTNAASCRAAELVGARPQPGSGDAERRRRRGRRRPRRRSPSNSPGASIRPTIGIPASPSARSTAAISPRRSSAEGRADDRAASGGSTAAVGDQRLGRRLQRRLQRRSRRRPRSRSVRTRTSCCSSARSAIGDGSALSGGRRSTAAVGVHTTAPARAPASERTYGRSYDFVITRGAVLRGRCRPLPWRTAPAGSRRAPRSYGRRSGTVVKKSLMIGRPASRRARAAAARRSRRSS